MKKIVTASILALISLTLHAQVKITAPGVKWENEYHFDRSNIFKVYFYSAKGELMRTMDYKTHFQADGENFSVILVNDGRSNRVETIFDKTHEVAIQIFGGGSAEPFYNTGRYKYQDQSELKKLDLIPTGETREIAGYLCQKFTYTYKKIFGEAWITGDVNLSNDYGIFRAAKMSALHNTLSVGGFLIDMTTEDAKGGKTLMQTISLNNPEKYYVNLKGVDMKTAINKVNYFVF
ncbi:MAG: hypothetical protein U1C46_06325 [Bacteroidales bacterium]|nr:hypothetical protein [Bacteroidales bacterium]MDZ4204417.1 hypothetical protein [Bacteroidales bacterium]